MVPVVGFRGFQGKDEEISDSRIVISSEARNLPCRPINDALETHFPALFHAACALSVPSGHLPLEGKADDTREPAIKSPSGIASIYTSRRFHILCAAPPFLISHFSFLISHSSKAFIRHPWARRPRANPASLKPQRKLRFFLTFS